MSELFTKPAILRLARKAGIKNLSEDCYEPIRKLMGAEMEEILKIAVYINEIRGTKTISVDDISDAMRLLGKNVAKSEDLSVASCSKKI
jgi:histone H3/H4